MQVVDASKTAAAVRKNTGARFGQNSRRSEGKSGASVHWRENKLGQQPQLFFLFCWKQEAHASQVKCRRQVNREMASQYSCPSLEAAWYVNNPGWAKRELGWVIFRGVKNHSRKLRVGWLCLLRN
jgi:hypothetical protein